MFTHVNKPPQSVPLRAPLPPPTAQGGGSTFVPNLPRPLPPKPLRPLSAPRQPAHAAMNVLPPVAVPVAGETMQTLTTATGLGVVAAKVAIFF